MVAAAILDFKNIALVMKFYNFSYASFRHDPKDTSAWSCQSQAWIKEEGSAVGLQPTQVKQTAQQKQHSKTHINQGKMETREGMTDR